MKDALMLLATECSRKKSQMIACNSYDFDGDWDRSTAAVVYGHARRRVYTAMPLGESRVENWIKKKKGGRVARPESVAIHLKTIT